MTRSILACVAATLVSCSAARGPTVACPVAAAPPSAPALAPLPTLTAKQALRDLRIVERALTDLHPGLFRYATPADFAAEMARARAAVADGSDLGEMYLLISRIGAAVRCGHTWTNPLNQGPAIQRELFDRADKLPVQLRLIGDRFLITGSAVAAIAAGTELDAIDGRAPRAIVAELLPYLRADGASDGKRRVQLDHGDDGDAMDHLYPLVHPPVAGRYALRVRTPAGERTIEVAATTRAARDAQLAASAADPAWRFAIDGDTAVLTLPTFAFWQRDFAWQRFLDDAFAQLAAKRVPYLIIDQRRNEGGDSAIGDAVLAYLIRAPVTFPPRRAEVVYERAPYDVARFLDTWDFGFFDRTGHVAKGAGRNLIDTALSTAGRTIAPAAAPFGGRTFVLIGPNNSSAGFLFADAIQRTGAATLVGEPTGGNQRGLNGGELAWVTLPESGVALDIPLVAWMPPGLPPDAGIAPDLAVTPRLEEVAAGIDPVMAAARAAIAQLRR
ncbi:MAG: hypothetical protein K8W52_15650 [Deltaproteobacteria bacterium]|nr:hypothetical protein [Deltaproteobacteria bacterium]